MLIDLNKPKINRRMKTRKGFTWRYIGKGKWLDETSLTIWYPIEPKQYNHHEALKLETKDKQLPTKEDFERAESHGIREIMDFSDTWFWSASVVSADRDVAWIFYGYSGYVGNSTRNGRYLVRCVSRSGDL